MLAESNLWAYDNRYVREPRFEVSPDELAAIASSAEFRTAAAAAKPEVLKMAGKVAVVSVAGPLRQSPGMLRRIEVARGEPITPTYGEIRDAIRAAASDQSVASIVMRMSTPGGSVFGVSEVADELAAARNNGRRVKTYAENIMASAGYWIGCQADEIVCNEMAHVGSVGVFAMVVDESEFLSGFGIKVRAVRSTPGKAMIVPGEPVTDEGIADLEATVKAVASVFVRSVARGRGISQEKAEAMHTGEVKIGHDAVAAKYADRVVDFDTFLRSEMRAAAQIGGARRRPILA